MMRVNIAKLRGAIASAGYTQERLSDAISMDKSTFSRKIKSDGLTFSIGEMHKIVSILNLSKTEASEIFLSNISQ